MSAIRAAVLALSCLAACKTFVFLPHLALAEKGLSSTEDASSMPKGKKPPAFTSATQDITRCVCGEDKCSELSVNFARSAPDRGGYETLPSIPKNQPHVKGKKIHKNRKQAAERKGALRNRWLTHLGSAVKSAAKHLKQVFIARIHFPAAVTALAPRNGSDGAPSLKSLSISRTLGKKLGFTEADLSPLTYGTYLPVPNLTYAEAHKEYVALTLSAQATLGALSSPLPPPSAREPSAAPTASNHPTPTAIRSQLRTSLSPTNPAVELAKALRENARLTSKNAELNKQLLDAHAQLEKPDSERIMYLGYLTVSGGLNRINITSDKWHALNPKAANHLFGFKSWHETKVHMRNFWPDVQRPDTASLTPETRMTKFEKLLITKMRFQRALEEQMLAMIWGRTSQVSIRTCRNARHCGGKWAVSLAFWISTRSTWTPKSQRCSWNSALVKLVLCQMEKISPRTPLA